MDNRFTGEMNFAVRENEKAGQVSLADFLLAVAAVCLSRRSLREAG